MMPLYQKSFQLATVFNPLARKQVFAKSLLQQNITCVFFIGKQFVDCFPALLGSTCR